MNVLDQSFNCVLGDVVIVRQFRDGLVTDQWEYAPTKTEVVRIRVDTDNEGAQPMRKTR